MFEECKQCKIICSNAILIIAFGYNSVVWTTFTWMRIKWYVLIFVSYTFPRISENGSYFFKCIIHIPYNKNRRTVNVTCLNIKGIKVFTQFPKHTGCEQKPPWKRPIKRRTKGAFKIHIFQLQPSVVWRLMLLFFSHVVVYVK